MARYNGVRAVVLGLELNGLAVVRSLGRARALVVGIDSDVEQPSALSKYLLSRITTSDIRGPGVMETLKQLGSDGQPYALFPTMDATVLTLSEERDSLPKNMRFRLPEKEMVHTLLHKGSFRDLAGSKGLKSPGYRVPCDDQSLKKALEELRFPMVMKSTIKKMGSGPKAMKVHDRDEAIVAYHDKGEGEVILEEWIPGTDRDVYFCLQAYSADSELLASFTGQKIRQWPPLVGGTASAEPVDLPQIEEATTRFFKSVRFQGICSMEYKYDARDGQYYAIEPTVGRTDFQSGIAPANGVNIPLAAFAEMAGVSYRSKKRSWPVRWVEPVGDARSAAYYMEKGELTRRAWKKSLAGPRVSTLFALDDPAPWVCDLFQRMRGRLRRYFLKKG